MWRNGYTACRGVVFHSTFFPNDGIEYFINADCLFGEFIIAKRDSNVDSSVAVLSSELGSCRVSVVMLKSADLEWTDH
jgi:hypothetical protein